MWNCQHSECHNPLNCAICSKEGVAWCPHQECHFQRRGFPTAKQQSIRAPGIAFTPTATGNMLKLLFVAVAAAGAWWLLQPGRSASAYDPDLLSSGANSSGAEFSSWEPLS